jgi:hypothetical protein
MITEKQIIAHIRLKDLYQKDFKYLKDIEMWNKINPILWYRLWEDWIKRIIQKRIDRKIRRYKNVCKKNNKKQYIKAYK